MVVMGALLVMILGVGAFQMMQSSAEPPKPVESEKKAEAEAEAKAKKTQEKETVKNPDFALPLDRRDPFARSTFAVKRPVEEPGSANPSPTRPEVVKPLPRPLKGKGPRPWEPPATDVKPLEVPEPKFGYSLIGIISGVNPGAVFADASGNQRLVEVGQGIDGDSTLLSISRGLVRVRFHAKVLTLSVGGNASAQ